MDTHKPLELRSDYRIKLTSFPQCHLIANHHCQMTLPRYALSRIEPQLSAHDPNTLHHCAGLHKIPYSSRYHGPPIFQAEGGLTASRSGSFYDTGSATKDISSFCVYLCRKGVMYRYLMQILRHQGSRVWDGLSEEVASIDFQYHNNFHSFIIQCD